MTDKGNAQYKDTPKMFRTRQLVFASSISEYIHGDNTSDLRGALTLVIITKGKVTLTMNGTTVTGRKHDLIICPPNIILNESKVSSNFDAKVVMLSNEFILSFIHSERIKWANVFSRPARPLIHLDDDFVQLMERYDKLISMRVRLYHGRMFEASISHITLALLNDLACYVECCGMEDVASTTLPVRQSDVLFKKLITLVDGNLSNAQTPSRCIQYYADQLHVSPKYLTHVCKLCSGKTAKELIDSVLINRIEYMLLRSDLSVKEIAMQLGFPDVSNFGRYVKSKMGASPRAIRARAGK